MENFETFRLDQTGQQTQEILDQVSTNTADIAQLRALYEALTQSEPVIIQPSDTWPVADPQENVIYRVIDRVNTPPQSYSDYMWNGTAMVLMATYNNSIDNEPTPGSNNLVKSGGVAASIVFDISAYHANGSTLATYANLAAALGTDGANVPASVRKGGMSVKFVKSSDNKYIQARCMADSFTTDVTQWQGVDDVPTLGSNNLVKSGGVVSAISPVNREVLGNFTKDIKWSNGYINNRGLINSSSISKFSQPFELKSGETITIGTKNTNIVIIGSTDSDELSVGDTVTPIVRTSVTDQFETYTYTANADIKIVICVLWSNYSLSFFYSGNIKDYLARTNYEPIAGSADLINSGGVANSLLPLVPIKFSYTGVRASTSIIYPLSFKANNNYTISIDSDSEVNSIYFYFVINGSSGTGIPITSSRIVSPPEDAEGFRLYGEFGSTKTLKLTIEKNKKAYAYEVDTSAKSGSTKLLTSGTIYNELNFIRDTDDYSKTTYVSGDGFIYPSATKVDINLLTNDKAIVGIVDTLGVISETGVYLYTKNEGASEFNNTGILILPNSQIEYTANENIEAVALYGSNNQPSKNFRFVVKKYKDVVVDNLGNRNDVAISQRLTTEGLKHAHGDYSKTVTVDSTGSVRLDLSTVTVNLNASEDLYIGIIDDKSASRAAIIGTNVPLYVKYEGSDSFVRFHDNGLAMVNSDLTIINDSKPIKEVALYSAGNNADRAFTFVVKKNSVDSLFNGDNFVDLSRTVTVDIEDTIRTGLSEVNVNLKPGEILRIRLDDSNDVITSVVYLYVRYKGETSFTQLSSPTYLSKGKLYDNITTDREIDKICLYAQHQNQGSFTFYVIKEKYPVLLDLESNTTSGYFHIPSYYFDNNYLNGKVNRIKQLLDECAGNSDMFIFQTDQHFDWGEKHSLALVNYLKNELNIGKMFCGGDLFNAGPNRHVVSLLKRVFKKGLYFVVGNHEYLPVYGVPQTNNTIASAYYTDMDDVHGNPLRHYYYVDDVYRKIRYIILNVCNDIPEGGNAFTDGNEIEQLNWLQNTALNVDSGWTMIIFSHCFYHLDSVTHSNIYIHDDSGRGRQLINIIDNYNGNGTIAALLQGHCHIDRITHTPGGIPVLITTCDMNTPYYTQGVPDIDVDRTSGTINEHAFEVCILDKANRKLTAIRIGAKARNGYDNDPNGEEVEEREITY